MKPPELAVAVLFFERTDQTVSCVRSFAASGRPVYVLNQGSRPESRRAFVDGTRDLANVRLFDSPVNLGVARGRNRLLAETTEPLLFFTDSDITVETADWDRRLLAEAVARPDVEVFTPDLFNAHEGRRKGDLKIFLTRGVLRLPEIPDLVETNCFPGGAALVRRSLFDRLGGYDGRLRVGFEDFELAVRAIRRRAPIRVKRVPSVRLVHDHRPALTEADRRAGEARYDEWTLLRSFFRFTVKHRVVYPMTWLAWVRRQRAGIGLRREAGPPKRLALAAGFAFQKLWEWWIGLTWRFDSVR